ncbi:polyphosphate kinase [compost metagenome]
MYRNLHARVEAIVPVLDRSLKEKCWELLQLCIKEQRQAWQMSSDGSYTRKNSNDPGLHQILMQIAKTKAKMAEDASGHTE